MNNQTLYNYLHKIDIMNIVPENKYFNERVKVLLKFGKLIAICSVN